MQQVIQLVLRLPSMRKKVTQEMDKAKLDIEKKLVPQGPGVSRHLFLPHDGKTLEWILEEMKVMDTEMGGEVDVWKQGKLSGAVYRM